MNRLSLATAVPFAGHPALTDCRWKYLEAGIQRIMLELEQGIDMQIVSSSSSPTSLFAPHPLFVDTDLSPCHSIWESIRTLCRPIVADRI